MLIKKKPALILLSLLCLITVSCIKESGLEDCIQKLRIELRWIQARPVNDNESVNIEVFPITADADIHHLESDIYGIDVELRVGGYDLAQLSL